MPRPRNKLDMLLAAQEGYDKLFAFINEMTDKEMNTPFDFSDDPQKSEAHWQRDKNLRDVLIHLYEWQRLLLRFVEKNYTSMGGIVFPFLPEPYNWKTYGDMNRALWQQHQQTTLDEATSMLADSHRKVLALAESFSNEQLFTKKFYRWTGTSDLGSYFVSTLSSHYDWALKKLKAHRKKVM